MYACAFMYFAVTSVHLIFITIFFRPSGIHSSSSSNQPKPSVRNTSHLLLHEGRVLKVLIVK